MPIERIRLLCAYVTVVTYTIVKCKYVVVQCTCDCSQGLGGGHLIGLDKLSDVGKQKVRRHIINCIENRFNSIEKFRVADPGSGAFLTPGSGIRDG